MLDAGSGRAPYRDLFTHARYETADFLAVKGKTYTEQDYVCDLADIPVEDARFDHVLLTQVLEHIPEPRLVLAELHRVLKPGGTLWLTAPLFYAEHEKPYDFYRYTQFGLRHLLEGAGFAVREVEWMEGYLGTAQLPGAADEQGASRRRAPTTAAARAAWRWRWRRRPRGARGRGSPTAWPGSTCASSSPAGDAEELPGRRHEVAPARARAPVSLAADVVRRAPMPLLSFVLVVADEQADLGERVARPASAPSSTTSS